MMKILLLTLTFLMISCASKPQSQEMDANHSMSESDESESRSPITTTGKSMPEKSTPTNSTAPTPVASKDNQKVATGSLLDDAIRSQSDEKIFKASTQVLLQNSSDPKALNALALYNYKKGRLQAAKYLLSKALQVQASSEIYNNLGVVHLALEENREALQAFRQAFNLNPQDGVTAANLGAIFVDQKDYNKAVVALETAYQKGFRDARVLNNYAIALTATGKGAQAQGIYDKALKDQSNNKELLLNDSILLIEVLKKYKEGSEVLNRLKFVGVTPEQKSRIKDLENKVKLGLQ